MNTKVQLTFWRAIFALPAVFVLVGIIQMVQIARSYDIQILHSNWIYPISMIAIFIVAVFALFAPQEKPREYKW